MLDLDKIKRNVSKMASMNAPEEDIDGYISSAGATVDQVRKHSISNPSVDSEGWEYIGQHPFKAILQGIPETMTGKSLATDVAEASPQKTFTPQQVEEYKKKWKMAPGEAEKLNLGDQAKYAAASVADAALSPASLMLGPAELAAKTAVKGVSKLAPVVKGSSEKSYLKALGPTTIAEKKLAEKVVPELTKRKEFGITRGSLLNKAEENVEKSGEALEKGYEDLPKDSKVSILPAIKTIKDRQEGLKINGVLPDVSKQEWVQLDRVKSDLINVARAREVSPQTLREFRQVLDQSIVGSKKGFVMTGRGGGKLNAQRSMANSLRRVLADKYPDIAKLNKEYSFWSNMNELLSTTAFKEKSPLSSVHAFGAEKVADAAHPYIGIFVNLQKLFSDNVAWNTFSGSMKSRLADLLAKGENVKANSMILDTLKKYGSKAFTLGVPAAAALPMSNKLKENSDEEGQWDSIKRQISTTEVGGNENLSGDWAQIIRGHEKGRDSKAGDSPVLVRLREKRLIPNSYTVQVIKKDPKKYEEVARKYSELIQKEYGIPPEQVGKFWRAPSRYNKETDSLDDKASNKVKNAFKGRDRNLRRLGYEQ